MAYSRGDSKNIIVGAASLFIHAPGPITDPDGTQVTCLRLLMVSHTVRHYDAHQTRHGVTLVTLRMV